MSDTAVPDWDETPPRSLGYLASGLVTLWRLIGKERRRIAIAIALVILGEFLSLTWPLILKALLDYYPTIERTGFDRHVLLLVMLWVVAAIGMLALRRFVQESIFIRSLWHLENYWPQEAQEKLLALSLGYHERENTGRKIAKVNKGVEKLTSIIGSGFWTLLPSAFYLVLNAVLILVLDWKLGLLFVLPLVPAIWLHLTCRNRFQHVWETYERMKEESVGLFCQSVLNVRTVQSFVVEKRELARHGSIRDEMERMDVDATIKVQLYLFVVEMIVRMTLVGTAVAGLYFAHRGWSSIGTVAYIAVTGNQTIGCFWSIVQVQTQMMRDIVAAERMYALLNEPIETENRAVGSVPELASGTLAFEQVMLRYAGKTEPVFDQFDLSIEPGEMLALVGKSGSGKSSLVSLLLRAYDPTAGAVTIDGTDIRAVDRDWYRRRFAYVPQDVEIFDGTIRENIVYAAPEASEASVARAIEAACLEEVVRDAKRFPDGLATEVGERGVRLSGGERQRVGIARAYIALLAGAEVLVLDEATSSLDSESERVVQHFIEQLRRDRHITIVAIAHRLSTIREADRICVLDAGTIAEIGTHEQLLRQNGLYH
ncbi:MAG: ABC transporter ATP-binding protein, partial [Patescibacteria group bacterium]|nr:ABC transporter ATP-binding protein [Patescibacteria group bacterium]